MSDIAIKVEDVGKLYRLGEVGTGTLSQDLKRWWAKTTGKEDPFTLIGEANDRTQKGNSEFVWALKEVSFNVREGEVLGIIGRNGAGKSTLLKILSKVTQPTTGVIKIKGRIASLLEVGTGFHPDLTGRENVFLNGAILGMTRSEIQSKFDEIVDFAAVERYIDTPVKRYSSGMYVRLAFAVAAFLEPEILIVDEVLAVGDAEFQKKCLGRMQDVSKNDGRTVLFVSHNLSAVQNLCSKAMLLINGRLHSFGSTEKIIEDYLKVSEVKKSAAIQRIGNNKISYSYFEIQNEKGEKADEFFMCNSVFCELRVAFNSTIRNAEIGINIKNIFGEIFTHVTSLDNNLTISGQKGELQIFRVELKDINFTPGLYRLDIGLAKGNEVFDFVEEAMSFQVTQGKNIIRPGTFPSHVKTFISSSWDKIN